MTDRAQYVAALRRERAHVEQTGADQRRLADIDAELARFEQAPARGNRSRETAVPHTTERGK